MTLGDIERQIKIMKLENIYDPNVEITVRAINVPKEQLSNRLTINGESVYSALKNSIAAYFVDIERTGE